MYIYMYIYLFVCLRPKVPKARYVMLSWVWAGTPLRVPRTLGALLIWERLAAPTVARDGDEVQRRAPGSHPTH